LEIGQRVTITFIVTVAPDLAGGQVIRNMAIVTTSCGEREDDQETTTVAERPVEHPPEPEPCDCNVILIQRPRGGFGIPGWAGGSGNLGGSTATGTGNVRDTGRSIPRTDDATNVNLWTILFTLGIFGFGFSYRKLTVRNKNSDKRPSSIANEEESEEKQINLRTE